MTWLDPTVTGARIAGTAGGVGVGRYGRAMRFLHTSDWHLGRTLHGVDLLDHQAAYLDHLVELARAERVAAVLVAGDVYDRAVPPVEAVRVLSEALVRLAEVTTVVLTPGNHDSAVRLGYLAPLLTDRVRVRTAMADIGRPVVLGDDAVRVHALPYLDPDQARRELAEGAGSGGGEGAASGPTPARGPGDDAAGGGSAADAGPVLLARSHEAVTAAAMAQVRADLAAHPGPSVVMAHAFVVGGAASESERDIRVGGVDSVPAGVFAGVDYVALGHLHGPQEIRGAGEGAPVLRYSGSPLAYSFSERHQRKSTTLVELGPDGVRSVEAVPAPVPRRVSEVTGTLEELLGAAGEPFVEDWLRAVVTDDVRPPDLYHRLKGRFPHLLVLEHRSARAATPVAAVTAARDPLEVLGEFVEHVTGAPPTPAETEVLRAAYETALAEDRSA